MCLRVFGCSMYLTCISKLMTGAYAFGGPAGLASTSPGGWLTSVSSPLYVTFTPTAWPCHSMPLQRPTKPRQVIDHPKPAGSHICNSGPSQYKVAKQRSVCAQPTQQSLCISSGHSRSGCSLCTVCPAERSLPVACCPLHGHMQISKACTKQVSGTWTPSAGICAHP